MKKFTTDINNNTYFKEENIKINQVKKYIENNVIIINKDNVINNWHGFGGAITEATAYNYLQLDDNKKESYLNDVFSSNGLDYNIGRISIGSNDFCLDSYQYTIKKDLSDFSIDHDKKYIIPMLNDIYKIKNLVLIASPWSPPAFMKNNKILIFGGKLKKNYYSLYAKYLHMFINSYKNEGFNVNYITMQNEPMAIQKWESCTFSLDEQKDFIYNYLINELKDCDTNIMLWDHNREDLYNVVDKLYIKNEKVKAVGTHWYSGGFYNNINLLHTKYPDLYLYNSEMCCGYSRYDKLKWINDAELYLKDIISCMNNGLNAYLEWNILLNNNGGPSHKSNYVKSSIILNEEQNDYIKTPIYYYLLHICKFIKKDYQIIVSDKYSDELYVVSAKKNDELVIVILNISDKALEYNLVFDNKYIKDKINAHSIITIK